MKTSAFVILVLCISFTGLRSQNSTAIKSVDSTKQIQIDKKKVYSHARRATWFSVFLPGLGQAYNKKYWKIPIIYAGLGGFAYMYINNNNEYTFYRNNLKAETDDDPATINSTGYQDWQLQSLKDQYKKNRDFAIIGFFAVYFLNIIDANVDGHLMNFDVSDDLGLELTPWYNFSQDLNYSRYGSAGLSVKLNFR